MKSFFLLSFLLFTTSFVEGQDSVRLYGRVTDFRGNALDSVTVRLKNRKFQNLYETLTDNDGKFSFKVEKGIYYCLYAIKLSEYRKTSLEYWVWNVPMFHDLEINPRYDNLEIYGVNVFEPQVTPQESYQVYFRPMSLKKGNPMKIEKGDTVNMAPETISPGELEIKINGVRSEIISINKVVEYARGNYFYGYYVQVFKPAMNQSTVRTTEAADGWDKISIVLRSKETGETGTADAFVKRYGKSAEF
jgi:hypothetical protein